MLKISLQCKTAPKLWWVFYYWFSFKDKVVQCLPEPEVQEPGVCGVSQGTVLTARGSQLGFGPYLGSLKATATQLKHEIIYISH